jgi:serine/threonine protein kinase
MTEPDLEASLLQRWFPEPSTDKMTITQPLRFSETDLRDTSDVLRRVGQGAGSRIPRIYAVLRLLNRIDVTSLFLAKEISDVYFSFMEQTLPESLNPSIAHVFLQTQRVILSSALDLERETGRHRHFSSADDVPFITMEELGKGQFRYMDRVITMAATRNMHEYSFQGDEPSSANEWSSENFERELGTPKKLRHHQHIVELIGSYTDPRYFSIVMTPVAE